MSFQTLCDLAAIADQVKVTVLKVNDTQFMAVLEPSIKLAEKYPQLASPLQITATAADMDGEVTNAVTAYAPVLQAATSNFQQLEDELKAAQASAKDKKKPIVPGKPAGAGTTTSVAKPTTPMATVNKSPAPPDLFNLSTKSASVSDVTAPTLIEGNDDLDTDGDDLLPLED